ncbi:uncharacterized protein E0L32_004636 [Thyridium curvatum]|uniref:NAD(P)-binding domain-containing protein n=1 Tax=Thyridium curvatum TaxID=1093900 RepID=A0A507BD72_9PEZI|nr:uncharacterized protein E0L32_004636 [Thyridium curvatum]TPX15359.1 hypothetical protein E0L32_004636 [Thyridium curvatum]
MVVVAAAGGTGTVGRNIAEALIAQANHEVIIQSRTANPLKAKEIGVRAIGTDYKEVSATRKILEDNNVHTVISALIRMPGTAGPFGTESHPSRRRL